MPKIEFNCEICSKIFHLWPSAIKQGKGRFCSKICHGIYRSYHPNNGNFKKGFKHSESTIEKFKITRKGSNNSAWKGGKDTIQKNGYVTVYSTNHPFKNCKNRVYKHRLVMEKHLGRYLEPQEVVHHINGIRTDNRIENLMLFRNHSEHRNHHVNIKK